MTVDLRGIEATYDAESRTYSVQNLSARDAHYLIWGGRQEDVSTAENALRLALVAAEDEQMPEEHYSELFN